MRRLTATGLGTGIAAVCACAAHAATEPKLIALNAVREARPAPPTPEYSTQVRFAPAPARYNGFIAAVPISPAATIGFGRFYSMPKRRMGPQDQPVMMEGKKPRRAAVGLSLKF